jgi:hypothetical protein
MRKEIIIAILIGLTLGSIVVFGVKTAHQSLANLPKANTSNKTSSASDNESVGTNHTLLITSPEPNEIVSEAELAIIGSTSPHSFVSVVSVNSETTTVADENGAFNATLDLAGGLNTITITSFDSLGNAKEIIFSVIYTTADLAASTSATPKKEVK